MTEILIILGKLIASSALLYAFYWFVLRNKATYTMARLYLLLIPLVSIMMSGLTLKVLPGSLAPSPSPTGEGSVYTQVQTQEQIYELNPSTPTPIGNTIQAEEASTPLALWRGVGGEALLLFAWGAIAIILIVIALYHIIGLYMMSRRMKSQTMPEGFKLIRSPEVPAPCSFAKTVFMPTTLTSSNEDLILRHEKAHIRHAHFVDVWVMELMTRLLWFNPLLWLARNELRNVHEFEADHDVMQTGADMSIYQTLLLAQVMDHGNDYANGFNHSFIRRRFIEMKHSTAGTLGRIGKVCMCLWVALLFCGFTFGEKDALSSTTKPLGTLELAEPQMSVIEGVVEGNNAYVSYNLYLADDYMQIQDDRIVACENVVDGKFRFQLSLTRMTAGRVRGISSDGKLSPNWIDIFLVPGETVELHAHHNGFGFVPTVSYYQKAQRAVFALRNATNWESPHLPNVEGKRWEHVACQSNGFPELTVKEVLFSKDETVLRIISDDVFNSINIFKGYFLTDEKGRVYQLRRALYGKIDANYSTDARVFGGYYAFDPVPEKVKEINLMATRLEGKSLQTLGPGIFHIKQAPKPVVHEPNFKVEITVSQGINDSGYLISMYDKTMCRRTQIADIAVVNRQASFATYVDEPRLVDLTATFPDGSICTHCVRFPFVPGEHAEVKVMNGTFHLTGTTFYKQYSDADELIENAGKYHKKEETQALLFNYLKEHADEEGCVMRYMHHDILPRETILSIIPDKVKNGRFKDFFQIKEN